MKTINFFVCLTFLSLLSCISKKNEILTLVSDGEKLVIEALPAGNTTINRAKETFFHVSSFEYIGLDKEQIASEETEVNVYQSTQMFTTFSEMYNSLGVDLNKLCFTQSQIINFCQKNSQYLCQGGPTFFLIKNNDKFLVVRIHSFANGLQASFDPFNDKNPLEDVSKYHLVVPA